MTRSRWTALLVTAAVALCITGVIAGLTKAWALAGITVGVGLVALAAGIVVIQGADPSERQTMADQATRGLEGAAEGFGRASGGWSLRRRR